ncbi:MAG: ribonuclease E activity regulator RraA [Thermodesulfobacteriota bacterium]
MEYSTPDLTDLYPSLVRVAEPVFRDFGGRRSFGGEIVTIRCFEDNSLVKDNAGKPGHGKVMVVDGGGSVRKALLGDLIAETAQKNGWEGLIIYGAVRDVDAIAALGLGVKALASIPLKTERKGAGELNIPVTFAGVTFSPGEYVYADSTGIIVSAELLIMPRG